MLKNTLAKALSFAHEAHAILAAHESSVSRVVILEDTYRKLAKLSLNQDDVMKQAMRCTETKLFRAAHVMAWAAFMDFLEEKMGSDGGAKLHAARPKWTFKNMEELRETQPEYQLIDAARDIGLCTKGQAKALQGLLHRRNECAHPSGYFPGLNETIGYIAEVLTRIEPLQSKTL